MKVLLDTGRRWCRTNLIIGIRMFSACFTRTLAEEWPMCVPIVFFPTFKFKRGLQSNERWSSNKFTAIALIKRNFNCFNLLSHLVQLDKYLLHLCCNYWIFILLYLGSIRKNNAFFIYFKYRIYFKCSKFKQMFRISFISFSSLKTQDSL